jgi:hypothetical protein
MNDSTNPHAPAGPLSPADRADAARLTPDDQAHVEALIQKLGSLGDRFATAQDECQVVLRLFCAYRAQVAEVERVRALALQYIDERSNEQRRADRLLIERDELIKGAIWKEGDTYAVGYGGTRSGYIPTREEAIRIVRLYAGLEPETTT